MSEFMEKIGTRLHFLAEMKSFLPELKRKFLREGFCRQVVFRLIKFAFITARGFEDEALKSRSVILIQAGLSTPKLDQVAPN